MYQRYMQVDDMAVPNSSEGLCPVAFQDKATGAFHISHQRTVYRLPEATAFEYTLGASDSAVIETDFV
ncbi:hypothetical protein BWQ96_02500 [Gracilariopsis chorda]|uniref:Uncharacterized protein n=1 Tax=Gracilariopsis chorda TaxID=448386 RepID=A0A2V3J0A8_9FLOR|nr:hypothetical protein BWQ96_02500 [Gracilariopsis chorda]|eukprot:PXF47818.1 hypothetical protein BWQ96_02500 [Gracilariopsis chorda]